MSFFMQQPEGIIIYRISETKKKVISLVNNSFKTMVGYEE